jgi:hypothetical protein
MLIVPCPETARARVTETVTVTCWPAGMVPPALLSLIAGDDVLADQVTGPPMAWRVSWPVAPVPRLSWEGEIRSWPAGAGWPVPGCDGPGADGW